MAEAARETLRRAASNGGSYLAVLLVTFVAADWCQHLSSEQPVLKGQPLSIVVTALGFGIALLIWLALPRRDRARGWLAAFLLTMVGAWVVHLVLAVVHGDAFNHTVWLVVPILLLVFFKPPRVAEGWLALTLFGWAVALVLVATRAMEILGVTEIPFRGDYLIQFDTQNYWLPLSGYLGVEGRWPGPFGHSAQTGLAAALLVVLGLARWNRSSLLFVPVGVLTLLLTGTRSAYMAVLVGVGLLLLFSHWGPLKRFSTRLRIGIGVAVAAAVAAALIIKGPGLTGREEIWSAFIDLWHSSPWIGTGTTGIMTSGTMAQEAFHAHNMFIDELARYGLLGMLTLTAALIIGFREALLGAMKGCAAPLALISTYVVANLTNGLYSLLALSQESMLVIVCVALAAAWLREDSTLEVRAAR